MKHWITHISTIALGIFAQSTFAHGSDGTSTDDHSQPTVCEDGHDHGAEENSAESEGIHVSSEIAAKIGLKVSAAEGGLIQKFATFPAEINLNRDEMATVSPRYESVVKKVFFNLGDEVKAGDIVAKLENRETFATYDLLAPISGEIVEKNVAIGETVDPSTVLYEIADVSSVWADISIFPKYRHSISKGESVAFEMQGGCAAEGVISFISPTVSEETRTFTARCVLTDFCDDFAPSSFLRAKMLMESKNATVRVPKNAVQKLDGDFVVFIPHEGHFIPQHVQTGNQNAEFVEITDGLNVGDSYVSDGAFSLKSEIITSGMDPHAGCAH